ncbi:hypothetical protein HCN44_007110 [Aphidius gifuensis]|uniref:Uncharacterized protein n=1 Tax=Aphidius gifuensis TaxID=684658 RepID=A0A834XKV9_APHGI|nr:hypothetical protein HCN44_007110 [Aphidius gifuensis]
MEGQSQNKTTPTEIKKAFNKDMTIQLESIKEQVLEEGKKNGENSRDKQPTIVEQQQKQYQQHQQQRKLIEIESAIIIDHQTNNNEPEKIGEQVPSFSTNNIDVYPGFIEAIKQAKRKNKSHDVSFQMLFSCLSESVIKQHDIHLNEWWNYCLIGKKDPLETDLSVFIGYLEKKLNAGTSRDDFKSIASSVCLIASDKMAKQIHSLTFLFLEFAKYSFSDSYQTPELPLQNNSKKQDESKISSVQIENVKKSKLPELIDLSDDNLDIESPSTLLKKSKDLLNKNKPTNCIKKSVFLQKTINSSQLITPLLKPTSPKPPAIFLRKRKRNEVDNNMKGPITEPNNDQQITLINVSENNSKKQQSTLENIPLRMVTKPRMNNVVVDNESDTPNEKDPTIPIPKEKQNEDKEQPQSTLPATNNEIDLKEQQQKDQLPPANTNQAIDTSTKTLALAMKPALPVKSLVNHSPSPLIPCQLNTNVLECSSEKLKQNKAETTDNLQSKLSSGNTVQNEQQQQQLPSAIDILSNDVVPSTCCLKSSASTSVTLKLQTSSTETLIPAIQSPTLSANLSAHHDTQPLLPCPLNKALEQNKVEPGANLQSGILLADTVQEEQQQQSSENNNHAVDAPTKILTPVNDDTSLLTQCQKNSGPLECSSQEQKEYELQTTENLQSKVLLDNAVEKKQHQPPSAIINDELSNDDNVLSDKKHLQDDYDDNNIHETSTVNNNEPKYIDGKLAVCNKCGLTSLDFNHCYYCKEKIQSNPRTVAYKSRQAKKRDMLVAIDEFYRSVNVNNNRIKYDLKKSKLRTKLMCRTVKIGSYEYTPKSHVIINKSGLILSVPLLKDKTQTVEVHVKYQDIVEVLIHFGKSMPVIFFHTNTNSGLKIRKLLGMYNQKKPYYDPTSTDQTQKRIILLPESLNDKAKLILKKLFSSKNLLQKLTAEKADNILSRASLENPNNSSLNINKRQSTIGKTNSNDIVENMTIYPAGELIKKSNCAKLSSNSTQVITIMTIEKPKYVDGKLAVCDHCGFSSIDFNRCYYCESKIQNDPKTKLDTSQPEQKRHMMLSIDKFYKSLATNNIKTNHFDDSILPHTICSTSESKNLLSPDKNNTTDSDNNSQSSIENKLNNNKRKRSQLEVTDEEENSNEID